jgi:hypothetical protein
LAKSDAAKDFLDRAIPGGPTPRDPLAGTSIDAPIPGQPSGGIIGPDYTPVTVFGTGDEVGRIGDFRVVTDGNRFAVLGPDGRAATGYFDTEADALDEAARLAGLGPVQGPALTKEIEDILAGDVEPTDEQVADILARAGGPQPDGAAPTRDDFVVEPSKSQEGFRRVVNVKTGDIYDYNFTGEGADAFIDSLVEGTPGWSPNGNIVDEGRAVASTQVAPEPPDSAAFLAEKQRIYKQIQDMGYTPADLEQPELGYTPAGETRFPEEGEPPVYPEFLEPLTPEEHEAIKAYVSFNSVDPRGKGVYLDIGKAVADPSLANINPKETERISRVLDGAISKAVFPADTTVYRGISWPQYDKVPNEVGEIYEQSRYISTTHNFDTARNFASNDSNNVRTVLQFNVPKDMPGLDMSIGPMPDEAEVLLPRNTIWQVTGITGTKGKNIRLVTLDPVSPTGAGITPPAFKVPPPANLGQPTGVFKDGVELTVGDPVSTKWGPGKVFEGTMYPDEVKVMLPGSSYPTYLKVDDITLLPTEGTTPFGRTSALPQEPPVDVAALMNQGNLAGPRPADSFAVGSQVDTTAGPATIVGPYNPDNNTYRVDLGDGNPYDMGAEYITPVVPAPSSSSAFKPLSMNGDPLDVGDTVKSHKGETGTVTSLLGNKGFGHKVQVKWEGGALNSQYADELTKEVGAPTTSTMFTKGDKVSVQYPDQFGDPIVMEGTVVRDFGGSSEVDFGGTTDIIGNREITKIGGSPASPSGAMYQTNQEDVLKSLTGDAVPPAPGTDFAKATDLEPGTVVAHPSEPGMTGKVIGVKADGPMGEKTATIKWANDEEWDVPESYSGRFKSAELPSFPFDQVPFEEDDLFLSFPDTAADTTEIKVLGGTTGIGPDKGAKLVEWNGQQFVKKTGNSPGHITAEHAADQVYGIVGASVPEARLYMSQAGTEKLAEFIPDAQRLGDLTDESREAAEAKLREHFVVDALLGNWDVVGLDADNVLVDAVGNVHRVDNGGSLSYRAQGKRKSNADWDRTVVELDTMRGLPMPDGTPSPVNDAAKRAFGRDADGNLKVTDQDIVRQVDTLITPNKDELIEYMTQSGVSVKDIRVFKERIDYLEEWANKRRAAVATGDFDALIDPDELSRRARPSPPPTDETTKWLMSFEGKKSAKTSIPSDLYGGSDGLVHVGNKIDYYGQPVTVTGITDSDTLVVRYDDGELFGLKPSAKNYDDLDTFSAMDDAGAFGDPSRAAASGIVGDTIPGESVSVPGSQPPAPTGAIPMPKSIARIFDTPSQSGDSLMDMVRTKGAQGEAEVAEFYRLYERDMPLTYKQMNDIDLEIKKQTDHLTSLQNATPEQAQVWFVGGDKTRPLTPEGVAESARRKALTESYQSRFLKVKDAVDQRVAWKKSGLAGDPPAYQYGWGDTSPLPPIARKADGSVVSVKDVRGIFLRAPKDRPDLRGMIEHAVFNPDDQIATDIRYALHAAPWKKYDELANKLKALRQEVWGPDSVQSTKSAMKKYASAEDEALAHRNQGLFKLTKKEQAAAGADPPDPGLFLGDGAPGGPPPGGPPPGGVGGHAPEPGDGFGQGTDIPTEDWYKLQDSVAGVRLPPRGSVMDIAQRQGDIGGDYSLVNMAPKPRTFGTPSYVPKEAKGSWNWSEARRKDVMSRAAKSGSGTIEMSLDDVYRDSPDTRVLFERPLANAEVPDDRRLGDIFLDLAHAKVTAGVKREDAVREAIDEALELVAPKRTTPAWQRTKWGQLLSTVGKAYMAVGRYAKGTQMYSWTNVPRRFVGDLTGNTWGLITNGKGEAALEQFNLRPDGFAQDSWRRLDESWAEGMADSKFGRLLEATGEVDLNPELDVAILKGREEVDRALAKNDPTAGWFRKGARSVGAATGFGASDIAKRSVSVIDRTGRSALEFTEFIKGLTPTKQRFLDDIALNNPDLAAGLDNLGDTFSPKDVRRLAEEFGYSKGQAEHLARQWRGEVTKIRKSARDEVNRIFFDYKTNNLDEILNKGFFYHYWVSRATPLYLQTAIRNPAVMASYAHMTDAMQRDCERRGGEKCGYLKMFETAGGLAGYFNPLFLLSTTLINFEPEFNNPDGRMIDRVLDKVPAMLNPMLQGAISAIGLSGEDYLDPIASHGPRRVWSTGINIAKSQGWFGTEKSRFIDPTPEFWNKLVAASSEYLEGKTLTPWAKKVKERKPGISDGMIMAHLAVESIYARHGIEPGTDPMTLPNEVQDEIVAATTAIDMQQEETNPDAQQAFQDWQSGNWKRALGSMAFSGVGLGDPDLDRLRTIRRDDVGTPKEIAAAEHTLDYVEIGGPLDAALTQQEARYQKSGPPMGRYYNLMHNRIHYSPDELPSNIAAAGKIYMRDDLIAMSEDERKIIADEWLLDQGMGPGERQAYFDARDALSADPNNAEYAAYLEWSSGARDIGIEKLMKISPRYKQYINDLPKDVRNDPARLQQFAFSEDAYQFTEGERPSAYSDEPTEDAVDVSQVNPVDLLKGTAGTTPEKAAGKKDPGLQFREDLVRYHTDLALFEQQLQAFTGNSNARWQEGMNPQLESAMRWHLASAGIDIPSKPASLVNYEAWAHAQRYSGRSDSVADYIEWARESQRQLGNAGLDLDDLMAMAIYGQSALSIDTPVPQSPSPVYAP